MSISSSLYAGISGLSTMGNAMSVIGDNIANVNTVAFKSSRATFQDVLSQQISTASGSSQVGRGVTLASVSGLFAQGSFESSSQPTDLAIGGNGFFIVRAPGTENNLYYTRAGEFRFDQSGYLVNPAGYVAQGWALDQDTGEVTGTIGDILVPKSSAPVATDAIEVITNLDSRETENSAL
ncbi:MAG: flagellar hook-basal body complex protein, partial [Deltaproteobacteria bacterium]|nr:flagellar hook-basal body complex protein [Deltaproteobacteria bacterium]